MSYKLLIQKIKKKENIDEEIMELISENLNAEKFNHYKIVFSFYVIFGILSYGFYFNLGIHEGLFIALVQSILSFFLIGIIPANWNIMIFHFISSISPIFNIGSFLFYLFAFRKNKNIIREASNKNYEKLLLQLKDENDSIEKEINDIIGKNIDNINFIEKMEKDEDTKKLIEEKIQELYQYKKMTVIDIHKNRISKINVT